MYTIHLRHSVAVIYDFLVICLPMILFVICGVRNLLCCVYLLRLYHYFMMMRTDGIFYSLVAGVVSDVFSHFHPSKLYNDVLIARRVDLKFCSVILVWSF